MGTMGIANRAFAAKKDPANRFAALDIDGDKFLSEAEFVGKATGGKAQKAKKQFKKFNIDGDDKLSLEEFKATLKKKKPE